jgi:hypothetical protein
LRDRLVRLLVSPNPCYRLESSEHIILTAVTVSSPDTPLYNHPLPEIEAWLLSIGGIQDQQYPHCWQVGGDQWHAELCLEIEEVAVPIPVAIARM